MKKRTRKPYEKPWLCTPCRNDQRAGESHPACGIARCICTRCVAEPRFGSIRVTLERPVDTELGPAPIPLLLWCPSSDCGKRHVDRGRFAHKRHHTHACQACGMTWRPAIENTVGVQFLPGFSDGDVVAP